MHTPSKKNGCGKAYIQNYSVFSDVYSLGMYFTWPFVWTVNSATDQHMSK